MLSADISLANMLPSTMKGKVLEENHCSETDNDDFEKMVHMSKLISFLSP